MKDFVSILIPNYNKAACLKNTLDSILAQNYLYWECVIVDDHSIDDSWEILEYYAKLDSRFKIFKRPNHLAKGGNICRNYAYTKASGKFVIFFDSDDLLYPNAIKNRVAAVSIKNYDFYVSNGVLWNGKDKTGLLISNWTKGDVLNAFSNFEPIWLTQGVIIRREFIENNAITWDERVPFYQDVLYNLKLIILSKNYSINSEIDWIWHVITDSSLGSKTKKVNTYFDNYNLISSFYDCIKNAERSSQKIIFFSLNRIQFLIKANKTNLKLKPILANLDFLIKNNITLHWRDKIEIFILKMAIFSFDNNIRIGKSIYFRYVNSNYNSVRKKMTFNHFLSIEIPIDFQNLFFLKHD
jgi:glycosyltransferase involved in cell wall biosynthesis